MTFSSKCLSELHLIDSDIGCLDDLFFKFKFYFTLAIIVLIAKLPIGVYFPFDSM